MNLGVLCIAVVSTVGPLALVAACGGDDIEDETGSGLESGAMDATSSDAAVVSGDEVAPDGSTAGDATLTHDGAAGNDDDGGANDATSDATSTNDATATNDASDDGGISDAATPSDAGDAHPSSDAASSLDASAPDPAHMTNQSMTVQGTKRTYDITVPLDCATTTTKVPLVIILHGDGLADNGTGNDLYTTFGLEQAAKAAGGEAVFVYPDGTDNNSANNNAWNLYDDPGSYTTTVPYAPATPSGNDDVDYFDQMVTTFEQLACVDKRVFVTGLSSGAYMANQLARWRSATVTGVAPMSGEAPTGTKMSDYPDCIGTTGAVPAFIIHGTADTTIPPSNGQQTASYWDTANKCPSAVADCVTGTGALASPPATPTTAVTPTPCVSSTNCTAAPVTFCLVPGLDHDIWSGAGSAIWSFISTTN